LGASIRPIQNCVEFGRGIKRRSGERLFLVESGCDDWVKLWWDLFVSSEAEFLVD